MLEKLLTPKTRKFIFGNGILILLAASVFVIGSGGPGSIGLVLGTTEPFSIPFNTDTNKLAVGSPNPIGYSGSANAKTALGNDVAFDYSLLVNPSTSWQTFKPGGYITNTDPITGMQSITLEKNSSTANIGIYWSNTTIFTGTQYEVFDTSSPLTVYTDFNGDLPNYIKVVALGEANSTIKSGEIEFYCSDFSLTLSLVSSDSNMGNVYGAGAYSAGNDVTVTATAKKGYKFVGWYENGVLLSTSSPYSFTMPYGDTTIEGRFTYAQYNLTLSSEDETKGSVSGAGEYDYTEEVVITAIPNQGYVFTGWYQSTTLISTLSTYTFNMPSNALGYVAKFAVNSYIASVTSEDVNKGTVTGGGTYNYLQSVSLSASAFQGYSFVGWYEGESLVSSLNPYNFTMPYNNLTYVARYSANTYELSLQSDNTEKGLVSGAGTYAYGSLVTITGTPTEGNAFIGWYAGETLVSTDNIYSFNMPFNSLSYVGKFATAHNVDVSSIDSELGTVSGGGIYGYTANVTITANPIPGYYLSGWYDEDYNEVSTENPYTFSMPNYDITLLAFFLEFSDLGTVEKGSTVQFGMYPQSEVTDSTLISSLNAAAGELPSPENIQSWTDYGYYIIGSVSSYMWYIDITNETDEYRGVYFTSYRPYYTGGLPSTSNSYQDDNGYTTSSVYWFKYEPITWRVLDVQSDKVFLMADLVLDSQDYYYSTSNRNIGGSTVYANNYEHSHVRSWLNDTFYNTAFNAAEKARIQTTTVDNSVASTGYSSNTYACANTSDKVFLLSYAEATSATYGLSTTTARQLKPSPYALSQGVLTYTSNGNSYWWLRSPHGDYADSARGVNSGGAFGDYNVHSTLTGVVPALWISA